MVEFDQHLPCLLDRLTDHELDKKQESRQKRTITIRQYRDEVIRDLDWLLNSGSLSATEDLETYPLVAESVLNYGLPDLTGLTASSIDTHEIERLLKRAIVSFEPRLLRHTVKVRAMVSSNSSSVNSLAFEITGDLWAAPIPEHLYLKTEVDLETGAFSVTDHAGEG